ncbi:MAG: DUF721 domain-containing protein [Gemmatimonadales bacterium]|nr:DUF721 domain-containing protein [Gemmatimonadales bacterium]
MYGRPPAPLGDALAAFLRQAGIAKRVQQADIVAGWAALVGPQIAAVTEPEAISADGVLRVRVATAPWASELTLMAPRILTRLNAGREGTAVREIRWMVGPVRARGAGDER